MIVIKKTKDDEISLKVEKHTQYLEMLVGCELLVQELAKALNRDEKEILDDIKANIEGGETNE